MAAKKTPTKKTSTKKISRTLKPSDAVTIDTPRAVDVEFIIPEDFELTFTDNAFVQHTKNEFVVSFFQSAFPFPRTEEEYMAIKSVPAYCVARMVMTPPQMQNLLNALNVNFKKFIAQFAVGEEEDGSEGTKKAEGVA